MKIKNFVLDTNVLLHSPDSLTSFGDNNVYIPITVLEELDNFKSAKGQLGANCRECVRFLDSLRERGSLSEGVNLDNGGKLYVIAYSVTSMKVPDYLDEHLKDNYIYLYTKVLSETSGNETILVTKDINFRVKLDALGVESQDYLTDKVDEEYSGYTTAKYNQSILRDLQQGSVDVKKAALKNVFPNEYIVYNEDTIGIYCCDVIKHVKDREVCGIKPLNKEQKMALDALLDDSIKLVSLEGIAGTGKTLLSLAAAIEKGYRKILYIKPIIPIGKDIGFLPGDKEDKLKNWALPLFDNIELLKEKTNDEYLDEMIELETLAYMRGRNLSNTFIIFDEVQGITGSELKSILTRVGENSKIVLLGDLQQIDTPFLDEKSCGLAIARNKFKESKITAHVTLKDGVRSELASLAAELL